VLSRVRKIQRAYRRYVLGVNQVMAVLWCAASAMITILATLDNAFSFRWGFPWYAIPGGIGLLLFGLLMYRLNVKIWGD